MSIAILFLLCAVGLLWLAWRRLRGVRSGDWVRAEGTRLRVAAAPGTEKALVSLERGGAVVFGPVPAEWDPPAPVARLLADAPGPEPVALARPGGYRVLGTVDLAGDDPFGAGDAGLTAALHEACGHTALVLAPAGGTGLPLLLHGLPQAARGSAGGIGVEQSKLDALLQATGDPQGMLVEIERRRIRRGGWGTRQAALAAR
ncbi:hypothetical protein J5Y09_21285 [Roseomonas sp. PWR1]|uniref:Uncharacterized protein n=1 Tax=Roseomonas nitratireducens TaxID=2820810 RepID=A0ABS4AYP6_9PROT|nr:hypothetical protein [Neoroseomonas nitratireducens]MBP0466476.1 hypothetical protein [Neoroseomonas nitratireducens]